MPDRYASYQRLKFDRPHPKVLRMRLFSPTSASNNCDDVMHRELGTIWQDIDADSDVHAVIFTGSGDDVSAGGDLTTFEQVLVNFDYRAQAWKEARAIVYNMINCSKPIVSAMRGDVVGPGLACSVLADVAIAARDCRLVHSHVLFGIPAGDHAPIIWPLLCGMMKAKYYIMTGEPLTGEVAERIGVASLAVDISELDATAERMAVRFAEGSQTALRLTKFALNNWFRQMGPTFDASTALEFFAYSGPDIAESIDAFKSGRQPVFGGRCPL